MKTGEKKKILLSAAAVLAAVLLVAAALLAWRAVSFERALRSSAAAAQEQAVLAGARARLDVLQARRALEAAQNERTHKISVIKARADEFTQSLLILVNPWNEIPEGYEVQLDTVEGYLVDRRCARALSRMLEDCRAEGYLPIICSAYRTQEYQEGLYRNKIMRLLAEGVPNKDAPDIAAQSVALPGTSEHQLGLCADITDKFYEVKTRELEKTALFQWMYAHCQEYGFILRYPADKESVTGVMYEPWHFRYVGKEAAAYIMENNLCLEEFLDLYK